MYDYVGASRQNVARFALNQHPQVSVGSNDAAQVLAHFLRVEVNGPDHLDLRLLHHQAHDSSTDGPYTILDDANLMSRHEDLPPRQKGPGKNFILHDGGRW